MSGRVDALIAEHRKLQSHTLNYPTEQALIALARELEAEHHRALEGVEKVNAQLGTMSTLVKATDQKFERVVNHLSRLAYRVQPDDNGEGGETWKQFATDTDMLRIEAETRAEAAEKKINWERDGAAMYERHWKALFDAAHPLRCTVGDIAKVVEHGQDDPKAALDTIKLLARNALAISDLPAGPPIDMLLYCPNCDHQHIDEPNEAAGWTNPPHKSHLCRTDDGGCGHIWRPADVSTNGVASLKTKGERDGDPTPSRSLSSIRALLQRALPIIRQEVERRSPLFSQADIRQLAEAIEAVIKPEAQNANN